MRATTCIRLINHLAKVSDAQVSPRLVAAIGARFTRVTHASVYEMEQLAHFYTTDWSLHVDQNLFKLLTLEVAGFFTTLLQLDLVCELDGVLSNEDTDDLQDF